MSSDGAPSAKPPGLLILVLSRMDCRMGLHDPAKTPSYYSLSQPEMTAEERPPPKWRKHLENHAFRRKMTLYKTTILLQKSRQKSLDSRLIGDCGVLTAVLQYSTIHEQMTLRQGHFIPRCV
jgi:hypothetical protein